MSEMTEEELYARKAALLKRALIEADRLDKVSAALQAAEKGILKRDVSL